MKQKEVTVRFQVSVSEMTASKIAVLSEKTGMKKTALAALAVQAGVDAIGLALNPDWKDYFDKASESMGKTGAADA